MKAKNLGLQVEELEALGAQDLAAINRLLVLLAKNGPPAEMTGFTWGVFRQMGGTAMVVREPASGTIVGIGTLVLTSKLNLVSGRIEHVVVSEAYRGGTGRMILEALIARAKETGVTRLDLTTEPERNVANELYGRLGFKRRNTNVYRLQL